MTRLDSGCMPEQEAWIRSLPRRHRLWLLVLDVTLQLGVVAFMVWVAAQIPTR